jgi:hypothetical protein
MDRTHRARRATSGRSLLMLSLATSAMLVSGLCQAAVADAAQEWSSPQKLAYGLAGVSCAPEGTLCVAVDSQSFNYLTDEENPYDGYAFVYKGGAWSGSPIGEPGVGLEAVSCLSASACVAVDEKGRALTYDGTAWSAPSATFDPEGFLVGVSCASSAYCIAVDSQGYAFRVENGKIAKQLLDENGLMSVSCASTSFCVAIGPNGPETRPSGSHYLAYVYNGTSWSPAATLGDETPVEGVSCASSEFCLAVEGNSTFGFGDVIEYNGTGWLAPEPITTETLVGVSCPTSTFCTVLDNQGQAHSFNGTSWSAPVEVIPQRGGSIYVSCTVSGFCAAAGESGDAATTGTTAKLGAGCATAPGPGCGPPTTTGRDPTRTAVSCVSATALGGDTCTASVTDTATTGVSPPSGAVTFSTLVEGSFPGGPTCSLATRSASSSSCSVTFVPPSTDYKDADELAKLAAQLGSVGSSLKAAIAALERRTKQGARSSRAMSSSARKLSSARLAGKSRIRELEEAAFEVFRGAHEAEGIIEHLKVTISTGDDEKDRREVPLAASALGKIFAAVTLATGKIAEAAKFHEALVATQEEAARVLSGMDGLELANINAAYAGDASHAPSSSEESFPSASALASGAKVGDSAVAQKDHAVLPVSCDFACTIAGQLEESSQQGGGADGGVAARLTRLRQQRPTRLTRVVLGRGRIALAAGAHGSLIIDLSSRGRRVASGARSRRATLSLTIETSGGVIVSETSRQIVVRITHRHR